MKEPEYKTASFYLDRPYVRLRVIPTGRWRLSELNGKCSIDVECTVKGEVLWYDEDELIIDVYECSPVYGDRRDNNE